MKPNLLPLIRLNFHQISACFFEETAELILKFEWKFRTAPSVLTENEVGGLTLWVSKLTTTAIQTEIYWTAHFLKKGWFLMVCELCLRKKIKHSSSELTFLTCVHLRAAGPAVWEEVFSRFAFERFRETVSVCKCTGSPGEAAPTPGKEAPLPWTVSAGLRAHVWFWN